MHRIALLGLMLLSLAAHGANAADAKLEDLHRAAWQATAKYAQFLHACAPLLGDSYAQLARTPIEAMLRIDGYSGDDLIIAVDDADKKAADVADAHPLAEQIGKNGVSQSDIEQACIEMLNDASHETDVAQARLRKAIKQ